MSISIKRNKNYIINWFNETIERIGDSLCNIKYTTKLLYRMKSERTFLADVGILFRAYSNSFICLPSVMADYQGNPAFVSKIDVWSEIEARMSAYSCFEYCILYFPDNTQVGQAIDKIEKDKISQHFSITKSNMFVCNIKDVDTKILDYNLLCEEIKEENQFVSYCEAKFTNLEINAFDYNQSKFSLSEINNEYSLEEVKIARKLWVVKSVDGSYIAYVLAEIGIDLVENVCNIYPVKYHEEAKEVVSSILPSVISFFKKYQQGHFCINIRVDGVDIASMLLNEIDGVKYKGIIQRIVMDREGVLETKKVIQLKK